MPPMTSPAPLTAERLAELLKSLQAAAVYGDCDGFWPDRGTPHLQLYDQAASTIAALLADRERLEAERDRASERVDCPWCKGCGQADAGGSPCPTCHGEGHLPKAWEWHDRAQAAEARIAKLTNWAARALRFIDHDDIAGAELENDRGSSTELVESGYAALGLEMDDDAALAALAARDGGGG